MADKLIDLFFSFRGRVGRTQWLVGMSTIAAAAIVGLWLFNDDSYDESVNAVRGALTMGAVLWLAVCLLSAIAVCAKRLTDARSRQWPLALAAFAATVILCGRGGGLFVDPLSISGETLAFWAIVALTAPALVACLQQPAPETP